ncbi:protein of unknown function [Ulvibacter litoralis]|uniref:DUF4145 domain-containing protein n=3 Tax=Ulvibacter litoralis TaxID=227084 RepID=A0A1G7JH94_9FLAO|nr:protein of unknown function [Ulvibacter litoralis]
MKYIQPQVYLESFTCPHCGVLSKQDWKSADMKFDSYMDGNRNILASGNCQHCHDSSLWLREDMIYPQVGNAPFPNTEMPKSVKKIYLEAASISNNSPRGAAALLRLSLQILCKELGESGKNIDSDIKSLVQNGLPLIVQQSLDSVRVIGNDAVHPGQIDTDDIVVVNKLFGLINVIVEYLIALPNQVSGIYSTLPANKIEGIQNRDKKK